MVLPGDLRNGDLWTAFGERFGIKRGPAEKTETRLYDSFAWSLWFADRALLQQESILKLVDLSGGWLGKVEHSCGLDGPVPRFAEEFEASAMRRVLLSNLNLRALQPVAGFTCSEQVVALLDGHRKTVFRLALLQLFPNARSRKPILRLVQPRPLRGYDVAAAEAMGVLRLAGAVAADRSPLVQLLSSTRPEGTVVFGDCPTEHTLRPAFGLSPDQPAREACQLIINRMLAIARVVEPGIIRDIDTEFLHDYRICLRKVRSILSLVKGIYPPGETDRLRQQLKELARKTNLLRDLDVYLMARPTYAAMLSADLQDGLDGLFEHFADARARELKAVVRHLKSASYRKQITALQQFFGDPDHAGEAPNAEKPLASLVSARLRKAYRLIQRQQAKLNAGTPDAEVHALRIHCKKLRYLLEIFSEIYPAGTIEGLVKPLKKLQGQLGNFNDYAVQHQSLLEHADACARKTRTSTWRWADWSPPWI